MSIVWNHSEILALQPSWRNDIELLWITWNRLNTNVKEICVNWYHCLYRYAVSQSYYGEGDVNQNAILVKCSMITDHSLTLSNSSGYQMKTHLCITKMEIYKKFGHLCSTLQRLQTNLYRQTCRACKKSPIWHQQISMNLIVSCNILPELHYKFY